MKKSRVTPITRVNIKMEATSIIKMPLKKNPVKGSMLGRGTVPMPPVAYPTMTSTVLPEGIKSPNPPTSGQPINMFMVAATVL
ncbi:MAG: hypothetical protein LBI79_11010 [Nitrososphaerota archaeon]|nr:hypothetical protein [Nitrososphaerota archaeon]